MSISAFNHLREWLSGNSAHSIVCDLKDRHEMMAIFALRQAQSLCVEEQDVPDAVELNGKLWISKVRGARLLKETQETQT